VTDTALNYGANEESADWYDFRSQVLEFYNYHTEEYMASSEVADWGRPEDAPTATLVLDSDYGVTYRIPLVFCPIRREACIEVNGDPWEELCERSVYCWLWHEEGHARRALADKLGDYGESRWRHCQKWGLEQKARAEAAEAKLAEARAEIAELRKLPTVTEREELEEKLAEARAFLTVERGERENLAELLEQLTLAVGAPDFAEAVRLAIAERGDGGGK